jgi:hypothetical protein
MNVELTKTEYELLTEVLESYVATCEAGMVDEIFNKKSDKIYRLINKLKQ